MLWMLNFWKFYTWKCQKYPKIHLELLIWSKWLILGLQVLSGRKILKFPHYVLPIRLSRSVWSQKIGKFCYQNKSTDQFETMKCRGKWSWLWSLVKVAMVYKPWGQGPQTGPSLVSLHSTFGKHGGGSSEHSGLLMRQALHSCKAFLNSIVSCFWMLTSALSFLNASIWKKKK